MCLFHVPISCSLHRKILVLIFCMWKLSSREMMSIAQQKGMVLTVPTWCPAKSHGSLKCIQMGAGSHPSQSRSAFISFINSKST